MVSWNLKFGIWILDSIGIVDWICEFRIFIWSIWILNGGFELWCLRFRSLKSWSLRSLKSWSLKWYFGFEWTNLKFGSCLMGLRWYLKFMECWFHGELKFEIWVWNRMGLWILLVNFGFSFGKRFVFWRDIWILNGGFWIWSLMREVVVYSVEVLESFRVLRFWSFKFWNFEI